MNMQKDLIKNKADLYAHQLYGLSRLLPKEELFGLISQLRRAALSVPLNVIEGFARLSVKAESQFLTIAYGSLKESEYIIQFASQEKFLTNQETSNALELADELGKLLWTKI